ncbi:MAG: carbon storage regulator [Planctomycetes bacterium]|nr:carbon storage regulator [Planctomycetota bacterium]
MLMLARRVGEEIVINGNIRVLIAAVKGRQVRLAISAPATVEVLRHELLGAPPIKVRSTPHHVDENSRS